QERGATEAATLCDQPGKRPRRVGPVAGQPARCSGFLQQLLLVVVEAVERPTALGRGVQGFGGAISKGLDFGSSTGVGLGGELRAKLVSSSCKKADPMR